MDKTADPNAYIKTKASSILNELPPLPNMGMWIKPSYSAVEEPITKYVVIKVNRSIF